MPRVPAQTAQAPPRALTTLTPLLTVRCRPDPRQVKIVVPRNARPRPRGRDVRLAPVGGLAANASSYDPHAEYTERLARHCAIKSHHTRVHLQLGNARLVIAVAAAALDGFPWPALSFLPTGRSPQLFFSTAVAIYHEIVIRRIARAHRAIRYYERGLDRLNNNWAGRGQGGERFHDPSHPYAEDLDVFGKGSLFELLNTARLRSGEETLAQWLLKPAPPARCGRARMPCRNCACGSIFARTWQIWVKTPDPESTTRNSRHGRGTRAFRFAASARDRSRARRDDCGGRHRVVRLGLSAALPRRYTHPEHFCAVTATARPRRRKGRRAPRARPEPVRARAGQAGAGGIHQRQTSRAAAALDTGGLPASHHIARLNRIVDLIDSRDNVAVRLIGPFLLWTTQSALALEAWRSACGPSLRRWLEAAGEIEALSALGNYAYEHPGDPFPEFEEGPANYSASGISHPLLPPSRAVPNDVRLGPECRVLIVSGSNMSGKSTLLRTIGVNAVLAMAGAPVRAQKLSLSPVAVGASIRVMDSLQSGSSRFYAEITRLRLLADIAAGPLPLLFLLDELLHGTNSHDRKIGAEAIVKGLVKRGAIGLITTHDLALAHIADVLQPHGLNVHFEDQLTEGRISFDYVLRPGIVRKSNALELMRYVGLEV